ncbi:hypothetical protein ECANGB1_1007 [Enterospora canceri]|uniref:Coatomer subunit delta n=1 Tax=Enterospora canceri TaxID=1081671 RepID=A0A1Y1S731_9MICR|nr:hypothetical protein ECANGB1_1007 [Enterospora canceri]
MNYFVTEFTNEELAQEGVIEKETYRYVYTTNGTVYYVAQTDLSTFLLDAHKVVKYIRNCAGTDMYEVLYYADNILCGDSIVFDNVQTVNTLESQDERIHEMMVAGQRAEMQQRAKEHQKKMLEDEMMNRYRETVGMAQETRNEPISKPVKKKVVYKSEKPLLLILKEKLNVEMDKENYVKVNQVSGEMVMVIYDAGYKAAKIKMGNLNKACKFSPYLDKNALTKSTFKFEKERQIEKSIPLLKWSGKLKEMPIGFEYWVDEENGKYCYTLTFKATRKIRNLRVGICVREIGDLEIDGEYEEGDGMVYLVSDKVEAGGNETFEVKYSGLDVNGLFPLELEFVGGLETKMSVESVLLGEEETSEFEFRRVLEIDKYTIEGE